MLPNFEFSLKINFISKLKLTQNLEIYVQIKFYFLNLGTAYVDLWEYLNKSTISYFIKQMTLVHQNNSKFTFKI